MSLGPEPDWAAPALSFRSWGDSGRPGLMMFAFGLMFANFTALAMEPQGRIAGTASSLYGSITTLLGIGIGTVIGQDYDRTLLPFAIGFFFCALAALAVVLVVEKGRLFKPHGTSANLSHY